VEGRPEGREGGRSRGGRGRGRRDERGPRQDGAEQQPVTAEGGQTQLGFVDTEPTTHDAQNSQDVTAPAEGGNDNREPREKRSRDRYGRDRGPRGDRAERSDEPRQNAEATSETQPEQQPVAERATPVAAPVAAPASAASAMPKVTTFELPKASLEQVAEQSGLQWVNSDPERIALVQATIAAEAKAIHVPRERPAPVTINEGPLILVETKRDLRNMTLPFEEAPKA
jgi:ribonuclease E